MRARRKVSLPNFAYKDLRVDRIKTMAMNAKGFNYAVPYAVVNLHYNTDDTLEVVPYFTKIVSASNPHSLFRLSVDTAVYWDSATLYLVREDGSVIELYTHHTNPGRVHYAKADNLLIFGNRTFLKFFDLHNFHFVEKEAQEIDYCDDSPDIKKSYLRGMSNMDFGDFLTTCYSRLFLSRGSRLFYSEPFLYWWRLDTNFLHFDSEITNVFSFLNSLFVTTEFDFYHLRFTESGIFSINKFEGFGGIRDSAVVADNGAFFVNTRGIVFVKDQKPIIISREILDISLFKRNLYGKGFYYYQGRPYFMFMFSGNFEDTEYKILF